MFDVLRYFRRNRALIRAVLRPQASAPGKDVYKPTTTPELREFLRALGGPHRRYLEIGCDVGLTLSSVADVYEHVVGIEIDATKARIASLRARRLPNVRIVRGTAFNAPPQAFDVVLIDTAHGYVDVLSDLLIVLNVTTAGTVDLVFHDYGLVGGGVRALVEDLFNSYEEVGAAEDWNPLGKGSEGPEAAWTRVDRAQALAAIRKALAASRSIERVGAPGGAARR